MESRNMLLTLQRLPQELHSTPGKLAIDGVYFCATLEPALNSATPPIPAGRYPVSFRPSPKFLKIAETDDWFSAYAGQMPHIDYKPNSVTMIHVGNSPEQTEDCVLVGFTPSPDFLGNSRAAFAQLYTKIRPETCQIEILDAPNNAEDVQDAETAI